MFKDQTVAIAPIRTSGAASVESDPLLSKDIRFLFEPNSAKLDIANQDNIRSLEAIKRLLQVSPGSTLLLRGHVDNAKVAEFRKTGRRSLRPHPGAAAMELSKNRAGEIRRLLIDKLQHRSQAHRHRRPRLGRAGGTQLGSEPARRSAVVHGGVSWSIANVQATPVLTQLSRRSDCELTWSWASDAWT